MREARRPFGGFASLPGAAAAIAAFLPAAEGRAATSERISVAVTGGAGFSTNPFLQEDSTASGFVNLGITPSISIEEERGQAVLEASARTTQYITRYDASYEFGARVSAQSQLSETITIRGNAEAQSSIVGESGAFAGTDPLPVPGVAGPADPNIIADPVDELVDPFDPDLGLVGEQRRRNNYSAQVGLNARLNAEDSFDFSAQASQADFPSDEIPSYSNLGAAVSFNRKLSEISSAGISASIQHSRSGFGRRTTSFQPQILYSGRVYPAWSFNLALGGFFLRSESPGEDDIQSTGFSGSVGACRSAVRTNFCFGASQGTDDNGSAGVGKRTSFFTRLVYRLSEVEDLGIGGSLAKVKQSTEEFGGSTRQLNLDANYSRLLGERWQIGVTAGYRDLYGGGRSVAGDLSARVNLSLRWGR